MKIQGKIISSSDLRKITKQNGEEQSVKEFLLSASENYIGSDGQPRTYNYDVAVTIMGREAEECADLGEGTSIQGDLRIRGRAYQGRFFNSVYMSNVTLCK